VVVRAAGSASAFPAPAEPHVMSRPVPEAAPLVGVVLAFGFSLYGGLFSTDHLSTALGTTLLLYPFVGFGIGRSEDPVAVFKPDPVLAGGVLAGATLTGYGLAVGRPVYGAFVAAVVAVPPALYHTHYGTSINPVSPMATGAVGLLAVVLLLAVALAAGRPLLGALTAALVGLAAIEYRQARGAPPTRRERSTGVAVGLVGGIVAFGTLAATGRPATGLMVGGVPVVVGAAVALGAEHR